MISLKYTPASLESRCAWLYLLLALPAMILLCFAIPPFSGGDESEHFLRSVALSEGQLLPVVNHADWGVNPLNSSAGANLDRAVADFALQRRKLVRDPARKYSLEQMRRDLQRIPVGEKVYARHSNTAIYPPLLYPTSTLLIWLASHLGLPILGWLYAARIGNALVGAALVCWSIRRGRDAAPLLLVAGFLPVMLFGLANVSTDALLMPSVLVFGATMVRIVTRTVLDRADFVMLALSTVLIGAGKVAYLPMALLPPIAALLLDGRFTRRVRDFSLITAATIGLWLFWALCIHDKVFSIRGGKDFVDPDAQLAFMLHHPITGISVLGYFMIQRIPALTGNLVGTALGWMDVHLPAVFGLTAIIALIASALPARHPLERPRRLLSVVAVIAAICYFAVFFLIYLQFNPVGAPRVDGVQGRYMFPIALCLLCLTPRIKVDDVMLRRCWYAMLIWCTLSVLITITAVIERHWL